MLNGKDYPLKYGSTVVIPERVEHNIINTLTALVLSGSVQSHFGVGFPPEEYLTP